MQFDCDGNSITADPSPPSGSQATDTTSLTAAEVAGPVSSSPTFASPPPRNAHEVAAAAALEPSTVVKERLAAADRARITELEKLVASKDAQMEQMRNDMRDSIGAAANLAQHSSQAALALQSEHVRLLEEVKHKDALLSQAHLL